MSKEEDIKKASQVISDVAKLLGDTKPPRIETWDSLNSFRLYMGWDKHDNPYRFGKYLEALMKEFPDKAVCIDGFITVYYDKWWTHETYGDTINRFNVKNTNYLNGILDRELCNNDFIETMREHIKSSDLWCSGYLYQLMINPDDTVCKLSGITKGYFMGAHTLKEANDIKELLQSKIPDSIVFICKHKPENYFIIQTWNKYIPHGWKQSDFEYKRKR